MRSWRRQRKAVFDYMPKFSIVIPVYKTPERYLKEMLDSILAQTYAKLGALHRRRKSERRERGADLKEHTPGRTSGSGMRSWARTGESPATPTRPWRWQREISSSWRIMTIPLTPNALYECAKAINEHPECDVHLFRRGQAGHGRRGLV